MHAFHRVPRGVHVPASPPSVRRSSRSLSFKNSPCLISYKRSSRSLSFEYFSRINSSERSLRLNSAKRSSLRLNFAKRSSSLLLSSCSWRINSTGRSWSPSGLVLGNECVCNKTKLVWSTSFTYGHPCPKPCPKQEQRMSSKNIARGLPNMGRRCRCMAKYILFSSSTDRNDSWSKLVSHLCPTKQEEKVEGGGKK